MQPISIVIITYNEEKKIKDCLDSIIRLDYPKYEIIVVDASQDKTPDIINQYKQVKLVKAIKKGFSPQRNLGIKEAKYPCIAFIDADCIAPKDWLKILSKRIEEEKVTGIGGNAFTPKGTKGLGKYIACLGFPAGGDIGLDANVTVKKNNEVSHLATCNALFKKKYLEEAGYFNEALKHGGEDTDICNRLIQKGGKILYEDSSFVYHKPRTSILSFIKWSFRRGKAKYHLSKKSALIGLGFSCLTVLIPIIVVFFPKSPAIFIAIYSMMVFSLFKVKRFKLLLQRRKRIQVSQLAIFTIIAFLFFLRTYLLHTGALGEALLGNAKKNT